MSTLILALLQYWMLKLKVQFWKVPLGIIGTAACGGVVISTAG